MPAGKDVGENEGMRLRNKEEGCVFEGREACVNENEGNVCTCVCVRGQRERCCVCVSLAC